MQKRKTTLNEITRTLPARFKVKSPPTTTQTSPQQPPVVLQLPAEEAPAIIAAEEVPADERPKSRSGGRLYDPANPDPKHSARASSSQQAQRPEQTTVPILQRPPSERAAQRAPKLPKSPTAAAKAKGVENGTPHPPPAQNQTQHPAFKILARPASVRGQKSPGVVVAEQERRGPSSPLRNETPKAAAAASQGPAVQVQVLKRPESVDPVAVQRAAQVVEEEGASGAGVGSGDKREQLLALFGKGGGVGSPLPAAGIAQESAPPPNEAETKKAGLLGLFTTASPASTSFAAATPTTSTPTPTPMQPPPRPALAPERKPSSQHINPQLQRQQTPQQNVLLDLFTRPSASGVKVESPGTPISPFTLGTPAQRHAPMTLGGHSRQASNLSAAAGVEEVGGRRGSTPTPTTPMPGAMGGEGQRSRLGSLASVEGGSGKGDGSRKGSGAGTPVEAKGFLLDYLNGVVRKEGYKGARRG